MRLILLITLLLVAGCSDNVVPRQFCSEEQRKEASNFVILCAEAANPMSDEEPEDMLIQCQKTAEALICEQGFKYLSKLSVTKSVARSCKTARTVKEKKFCGVKP